MNYEGMYLQEIRVYQALAEIGETAVVKVDHATPRTWINDKEYALVFPKSLLKIKQKKDINLLFIGQWTEKREVFLNKFTADLIAFTERGRNDDTKVYDLEYFNHMARAKFVLCPDGDFAWTYRFFEAIIFDAIPVVETACTLYEGYKFYREGDKLVYRAAWMKHNLAKLQNDMML